MNWLPPSNNPNDFDALMTRCLHLTFKRLWGKSIMYIYKATFNTCSNLLIPIFLMYARGKILYTIFCTPLNNCLRCPEANDLSWGNVKDLSSLNFDRQFLMLFIFMFVQGQPEMKSGHFMPAPYTPYLVNEAMGIFYTIQRCHQVSFSACPHPIDPHCCKPHQQIFLLPTKGLGIPF